MARRAENFLGVNMRCRKDFAVGKEIRTSRKFQNSDTNISPLQVGAAAQRLRQHRGAAGAGGQADREGGQEGAGGGGEQILPRPAHGPG